MCHVTVNGLSWSIKNIFRLVHKAKPTLSCIQESGKTESLGKVENKGIFKSTPDRYKQKEAEAMLFLPEKAGFVIKA